ncbi:MAG: MBL fold metallo-hydrolase [Piscirickettsiaceae bacterium]|nr:MAG: MBL fold metallo-hydrolase [Piscirickettsiaceae bacterium]
MGCKKNDSKLGCYGCYILILLLFVVVLMPKIGIASSSCGGDGVWLQVLGSGGPEILQDGRASSSYIVWLDGKSRLLVDAGAGSALNFGLSGAKFEDLDAIVFSHFHVDHSADLPAFIKASYFGDRTRDLPLFGPSGNKIMPSTKTFLASLFGSPNGAFSYLSDFVDSSKTCHYKIKGYDIPFNKETVWAGFQNNRIKISAISVHHGPLPALAWRVDIGGHSISFSGDMNGDNHSLEKLAVNSDLLVAHNAIPESAKGVARALHMPPSVIGKVAKYANVKQLVLSHRMSRTIGHELETGQLIQQSYTGLVSFANDLDCFRL